MISYEKVRKLHEEVSPWALSSKPYHFIEQCASTHLKKNTRVLGEEKLHNHPEPTLFARCIPMLFFLASTTAKPLEGRRYHSRQDVRAAVIQCLKGAPKKDYAEAFHK